jgi:peptide/nickel transport system substrate-binding protein
MTMQAGPVRRRLRPLLLALAAAGALATPALAQSSLRIGLAEDPDVLDPTMGRTYVGRIVFAALCDKLFDIDDKLNLVPQLALGQETSPDGKAVTIRLRPNVTFHDGEPMDAQAVKFSLERHLTLPGSFRKPEISAIDTIDVVDPLTVKLNLKAPFSPLIAQLTDRAGMIVSPKAAREAGERFGQKPVCAGPYKFVERVQQDRIVVERFADYWDKDKVTIDRIVYRPIQDSTVRLANLKSGQLDLIERALATDIKDIKASPRLRLVQQIDLGYQGLTLNVAKGEAAKGPLGSDPRVRQALDAAIDRDAINEVVFGGAAMPGNQWINPTNAYYQAKYPVPKRDLAKAKRLLAEAGAKTPVAVDLMVPNNPETRAVAEVMQAMAAEAGFDLKIRITEFATSLNEAEAGRFQAYMLNWSGRTDPDGNLYIFHRTGAPQNYGGYSNPEVDRLLDEARLVTGQAERKALYERVTGILLTEGSVLYLYHRPIVTAHTDRLEGFKSVPDGLVRVVGLKLKP